MNYEVRHVRRAIEHLYPAGTDMERVYRDYLAYTYPRSMSLIGKTAQLIADTERETLAKVEAYAQSEFDLVNKREPAVKRALHSQPFLNAMQMVINKCRSLSTPQQETAA